MSRIGLGRHGQLDSEAGDPLDGVVNLFDVGLVLAIAFLVAGLGFAKAELPKPDEQAAGQEQTLTEPDTPATAEGRGEPAGQAYRLPDGTLVLVDPSAPKSSP